MLFLFVKEDFMSNSYYDAAISLRAQMIRWRRDLHQIPELGIHLPKTVKYVSDVLNEAGIEHEIKDDISCIFATIGHGPKCILLRADMDGLPGTEKSGESFASTGDTFHGCGHDMHTSSLLGAALILKEHENELPGTVKLLFQSGEEIFKGAACAIDAGILESPHVDAAFGMHSFAQYDTGIIVWGDLFMGAVYGFRIHIHGIGGHGSQPESCADPITAGVHIHLGLQELLSRECPPRHAASLTIGHFESGSAANIIPDGAIMEGTLRCFESTTRTLLIRRINEIVPAIAAAYRCTAEIEVLSDVPCNYSEPVLTQECMNSVKDFTNGFEKAQFMGSEDFAFFAERIPSAYLVLGAGVEGERFGQHNPQIRFNEDALPISAACYVNAAIDWLNNHA